MHTHGFTDKGSIKPDNLFAGEFPNVQRLATIKQGEFLKRGAVLGMITDTGLYVLSKISASDDSEVPHAILAEDVDAMDNDTQAVIYLAGEFNANALIYGTGHNAEIVQNQTPDTIYLRNNQSF